jgi:hypothetical protein
LIKSAVCFIYYLLKNKNTQSGGMGIEIGYVVRIPRIGLSLSADSFIITLPPPSPSPGVTPSNTDHSCTS